MNYLGLDYGAGHVGVALAAGPLAEPLTTLSTSSALSQIKKLIVQYQIAHLVIGQSEPRFLSALKSLGLPVHQVDETLTTKDAQSALFHTTQTRRKTQEHSVAATLLLQSWLDRELTPAPLPIKVS